MDVLIQDLRYALRQLRKSSGLTIVALLTLALGIGANTGIFSLVNAVLLKSLPVPSSEQLYLVRQRDRFAEETRVSYPLYKRMLEAMPASVSLAAMARVADFYVEAGGNQPEMAKGQLVSGNLFQVLNTYPTLGRLLTPADNQIPDGHPVAVISYGCWRRRFSGAADVIGRGLTINGARFAVVGVTARNFFGAEPGRAPEFWLPLMMQDSLHYAQHYSKSTAADTKKPWVSQEEIAWLGLIMRVTEPTALPQVSGTLNRLFAADPWEATLASEQNERVKLEDELVLAPGGQGIRLLERQFSQPLTVLMGTVGMLLLIACANLAGLLLARATVRSREIAIRLALGANRGRLIRQLITECFLLSGVGGVLGIAIAYGCCEVMPRWASSGSMPIPLNVAADARVLLFSSAIVLVTGILFGLAPALQATALEPTQALKLRTPTEAGVGLKLSLRQSLVVLQFALSFVLLVGAGLFIRTLRNFAQLDPGFDRDHVISVWLDTTIRHYNHGELLSFYQRTLDRVQGVPGVRSASLGTCGLASSCRSASDIYLAGHRDLAATPQTNIVSLRYFENVGMAILRGREFAPTDTEKSPLVAIINQTLARKIFSGVEPLGQYFGFDPGAAHQFQVIGIISDAQVNGIRESAPPMVYFSLSQAVTDVESLDVRSVGDPAALAGQIRSVLASIDPALPIGEVNTLREQVRSNVAEQRLIARLTSIFGALAVFLSCLGLYGVTSYMVARRTAEIGIRLALGASRSTVLRLVLAQMGVLLASGILAGVLLSFVSLHSARSLLYGLSPYDPATMIAAAALLVAVSIASGLRPAWRAAQINPTDALRVE